MRNKLLFALLLITAIVAPHRSSAQGFIGNGTGNGIVGVTSTGTSNAVNVGIGTAAPSVTLEVYAPSNLGLKFDNLPLNSTPSYYLSYDGTGTVTYSPVPSGGLTSVDYNCIGQMVITPVSGPAINSIFAAWLTTGNNTSGTGWFGTDDNSDIPITTNNGSCTTFNIQKQKMIIAKDGSVGIGSYDGITNPLYPQNSLLVQRGLNTVLGTDIYTLFGSHDVGIITTETKGTNGSTNNALLALTADNSSTNTSITSFATGDNSVNNALNISVEGNNSVNVGAGINIGQASSTTNNNLGLSMNVSGSSSANTGIQMNVSQDNTVNNFGINATLVGNNVSSGNTGVQVSVSGSSPSNAGVLSFATGGSPDNQGVVGIAHGDNVHNGGVQGQAYGGGSAYNFAVLGQITGVSGGNAGSNCVGVYGVINSGADGSSNYGVEGDLYALTPSTGNTYYAIYGIAPSGSGSSPSSPTGPVTSGNVYAGFFDGDVFCANTYYYSDPKLKENIASYTGALDKLKQIPVKSYNFRQSEFPTMNFPQGSQVGVLSTDLQKVFPNLIKQSTQPAIKGKGDAVTYDAVNYNGLIPVLIEAVQELNAKTDSVTTNNLLTNTIAIQQSQISQQAQMLADQGKQINDLRNMLEDLCTNGCAGFNPKGNISTGQAVLYQSIPNPASGTVGISYLITIPYTTASINVVTMDGKLISSYPISTQGNGSISFDASSVAAGVYKYSLIIEGKVIDTKSMFIIKE